MKVILIKKMEDKKFQRNIEDFECENCGYKVYGNGYTNHCPICLWSKHVDINPGDRKSGCLGMMEPISVNIKAGQYVIIHKCKRCKCEKNIKAKTNDSMDELIKISILK